MDGATIGDETRSVQATGFFVLLNVYHYWFRNPIICSFALPLMADWRKSRKPAVRPSALYLLLAERQCLRRLQRPNFPSEVLQALSWDLARHHAQIGLIIIYAGHAPRFYCTETANKVCTWLREVSSCCCLTTAGKTRQLLLNNIYIPFLPSLYIVVVWNWSGYRPRSPAPVHLFNHASNMLNESCPSIHPAPPCGARRSRQIQLRFWEVRLDERRPRPRRSFVPLLRSLFGLIWQTPPAWLVLGQSQNVSHTSLQIEPKRT